MFYKMLPNRLKKKDFIKTFNIFIKDLKNEFTKFAITEGIYSSEIFKNQENLSIERTYS